MSYLTDLFNMDIGKLSLFKTDEEKEKERLQQYENNIAMGLLEMQSKQDMIANQRAVDALKNRATITEDGETISLFDEQFIPKENPYAPNFTDTVYKGLRGKYYTSPGIISQEPIKVDTMDEQEILKAYADTQYFADSQDRMSSIIPGQERGTRINPDLVPKTAKEEYLESIAQPFSLNQLSNQKQKEENLLAFERRTDPTKGNVLSQIYNLEKGGQGGFASDEVAKQVASQGISPTTLITLMSALGGMSDRPTAPTITSQPTSTPGLMFSDEDLYKKYRGLLYGNR
jgi:hypothetical protein